MNRKQKIVLWIGIGLFVAMGVFPPWLKIVHLEGTHLQRFSGYAFVLSPPTSEGAIDNTTTERLLSKLPYFVIDFSCLCLQWAMVVVVTGGLLITFKNRKDD